MDPVRYHYVMTTPCDELDDKDYAHKDDNYDNDDDNNSINNFQTKSPNTALSTKQGCYSCRKLV